MDQLASPASSDPLLAGMLARITSHRPDADRQLITRGYQTAAYWHQGQRRKSGDPYLTHPVAVAAILAELGSPAAWGWTRSGPNSRAGPRPR
jgi:guanosine-3',5'-bis(diphosphate) 3'-pyrophosphohydrolase